MLNISIYLLHLIHQDTSSGLINKMDGRENRTGQIGLGTQEVPE